MDTVRYCRPPEATRETVHQNRYNYIQILSVQGLQLYVDD